MADESGRSFRTLTAGPGGPFYITAELGLDVLMVRSGTRSLPRASGAIPGSHFASEREFTLRLWWKGASPDEGEALAEVFRAATDVSETTQYPYTFRHKGAPDRFVWVRVLERGYERSVDTESLGLYEAYITFELADPHWYSSESHSQILPLFTVTGGGLDWPLNWPSNWPAPSQEFGVVHNAGNAPAYPTLQAEFLSGGSDDWEELVVTNVTTGVVYTQETTIVAGQRLTTVFGEALTSIDLSGSDRYTEWAHPRTPLYLAPGDNTIKVDVTAQGTATEDVLLRMSWRDTSR